MSNNNWSTDGHLDYFDIKHQNGDDRKVYNFCAGPCVLPKAVLDRAAKEMTDFRGCGQSVLELNHRGEEFNWICEMTKKELRRFLRVPDNFRILLQQGGATM